MNLKNPFSLETRVLYIDRHDCSNCGSNQILELHHILGRISSSPFNACLLCRECHDKVARLNTAYLFGINMQHLLNVNYKPTDGDYQFLRENARALGIVGQYA